MEKGHLNLRWHEIGVILSDLFFKVDSMVVTLILLSLECKRARWLTTEEGVNDHVVLCSFHYRRCLFACQA